MIYTNIRTKIVPRGTTRAAVCCTKVLCNSLDILMGKTRQGHSYPSVILRLSFGYPSVITYWWQQESTQILFTNNKQRAVESTKRNNIYPFCGKIQYVKERFVGSSLSLLPRLYLSFALNGSTLQPLFTQDNHLSHNENQKSRIHQSVPWHNHSHQPKETHRSIRQCPVSSPTPA